MEKASSGNERALSEETQKKIADNKFFYSRAKYVFDYAMQEWYEPLEHATLRTEFLRLNSEEITALYAACVDDLYRKGSKPSAKPARTTDADKATLETVRWSGALYSASGDLISFIAAAIACREDRFHD